MQTSINEQTNDYRTPVRGFFSIVEHGISADDTEALLR